MKSDSDKTLFKNILKLISGEGIGRAVGFLMTPVITRLYTPTDFGMLAVFASVCVLCYPFCTLRYTLVIPLHTNEKVGNQFIGGMYSYTSHQYFYSRNSFRFISFADSFAFFLREYR